MNDLIRDYFSSHRDIPARQKENIVVQYTAYLLLSGTEHQIHACTRGSLKFLHPARIHHKINMICYVQFLHDKYLIRTNT